MWHIATYKPVSLFSLRPANATTAGGKTLVTPTPYALKMALLSAVIDRYGVAVGEAVFEDTLRVLPVAADLPPALLVISTFQRILRPKSLTDPLGTGLDAVWQSNIAYREYVHFGGALRLAVEVEDDPHNLPWGQLFAQINYLGKRGSFVQFTNYQQTEYLPSTFDRLNASDEPVELRGLLQLLDDCGPEVTFKQVNVYSSGSGTTLKINQPNGRLLNTVTLPYQMTTTTRGFTLYERIPAGD